MFLRRAFSTRVIAPVLVAIAATLILPLASLAKTADDAVMKAAREELKRTMAGLAKEDVPPYFLSYAITETSSTTLAASFGAMVTDYGQTRRVLDIDLRVGDHQLDNSHKVRGLAFQFGGGTYGVPLPMGDDVQALRAMIWKATDKAYRTAVERLEKVQTNMKVKVQEEDTSADMSREQVHTFYQDPARIQFDTATWRDRVRKLSAVFVGHPEIYVGRVSFQAVTTVKTFVNSEGTEIRQYEPIIKMFISVMSKADDGMSLPLYESYSAYSADRLPSYESLLTDARRLLDLCLALRTAPLMETYTGPAILSGRSAGVFFHEIFGHRVEGHRQKDVNSSQTFKDFVNKRVLPDFIDVVFDPTTRTLDGTDIVGAYHYDDEGMPGKKVVAVEKGIFKNFLMNRSPIEGFDHSNGHGRSQAGYLPVARQSNLMVKASTRVPYAKLKSMLRDLCKEQGKDYGLLFEDIQGGFTFTGRTIPNAFNVIPLVVYKIYTDGRPDELVRGVDLIGTPLTTFNNIVAAADDLGIFNGTCGAESGGVPVSASSPSLLVSTIEVQKKQKSQAKPPILDDPTMSNAGEKP
jgi:TldD protein